MTAPLVSVILPLMAPVVVLTVWPNAPAVDPRARTRSNTGISQCLRLMRLLRIRKNVRPDAVQTVKLDGLYTRIGVGAIGLMPLAADSPRPPRDFGFWARQLQP